MNEEIKPSKRSLWNKFVFDLWHLSQLVVALGMLYTMIVHVVYKAYLLFSGATKSMTMAQVAAAQPPAAPGITVGLPDPVAEVVILCIVVGVLTYVVLKYVCESEWVREKVEVEECWEEVKWYNPFSWVVALVCTVVEVFKWVLKQICKWVEVVVTTLVVACIVITLIIIFA
jgi:hypothetical protein